MDGAFEFEKVLLSDEVIDFERKAFYKNGKPLKALAKDWKE